MGFGDEIIATGQARTMAEENPDKKVIVGDGRRVWVSALHQGNDFLSFPPLVRWDRLSRKRRGEWHRIHEIPDYKRGDFVWLRNYPGARPYMDYSKSTREKCVFFRNLNLRPGNIKLTNMERKVARNLTSKPTRGSPYILFGPHVKATHSAHNKDWGMSRWNLVARHMKSRGAMVVSLMPPGEPGLECAHAQVSPGTFREACAVVERSSIVATIEGGIHHAAAVFRRRAVVIFGGYITPDVTGYGFHENICPEHNDSPCGSRADCGHCRAIMQSITVDEVIHKLEKLWEEQGGS